MGQQTTKVDVEHLRKRIRRGDHEAFHELHNLLAEPLARFAWQIVRDRDVASDLVQTAFMQIFENHSRVSKRLRGYAFSVVGNLARNHLRSAAVHRKWESENSSEFSSSESGASVLASQAWEALLALPVEEREPLLLRFDHGLGVREVAVVLDCPQGTAATRIRRGLDRLRAKLGSNAQFSVMPATMLPELLSQGSPLIPPEMKFPSWTILEAALMASTKKTSTLVVSILLLFLICAGIGISLAIASIMVVLFAPGGEGSNPPGIATATELGSSSSTTPSKREQPRLDQDLGPVEEKIAEVPLGEEGHEARARDEGNARSAIDQPDVDSPDSEVVFNVSMIGSEHTPSTFWLEIEGHGKLNVNEPIKRPSHGAISISAELPEPTVTCKVCATWFGETLSSKSMKVKQGSDYEVLLKIPAGCAVQVRVLGPTGQPLEGVAVSASRLLEYTFIQPEDAKTGENGEVQFEGVPADSEVSIWLSGGIGSFTLVERQTVRLGGKGDIQEVIFDLTGTGVVDCRLQVNGTIVESIVVRAPVFEDVMVVEDGVLENGDPVDVVKETVSTFVGWGGPPRSLPGNTVLYGVEPGFYMVWGQTQNGLETVGLKLEVSSSPVVTCWHQELELSTMIVRVVVAESVTNMRLRYSVSGTSMSGEVDFPQQPFEKDTEIVANEAGDFILPANDEEMSIFIYGGGYSSGPVVVTAKKGWINRVAVKPSGTLKLLPRNGVTLRSTYVKPVAPGGEAFIPWTDTLELPTGLYRIYSRDEDAKWQPVEVHVEAGTAVERAYGPEK